MEVLRLNYHLLQEFSQGFVLKEMTSSWSQRQSSGISSAHRCLQVNAIDQFIVYRKFVQRLIVLIANIFLLDSWNHLYSNNKEVKKSSQRFSSSSSTMYVCMMMPNQNQHIHIVLKSIQILISIPFALLNHLYP